MVWLGYQEGSGPQEQKREEEKVALGGNGRSEGDGAELQVFAGHARGQVHPVGCIARTPGGGWGLHVQLLSKADKGTR